MLIYVNITDRRTDGQTHQNYSSEPHKIDRNFRLPRYGCLDFKGLNHKFS